MTMHLTAEDFGKLDETQRNAILETMVIGLIADNKVNPAEVRRFDELVLGLPWGVAQPILVSMITGARNRLVALKTPVEFQDYLVTVAKRIPTDEMREKAVFTMATIMFSDGHLDKLEKSILDLFVIAFGITSDRVSAIKAALHILPPSIPASTPTEGN